MKRVLVPLDGTKNAVNAVTFLEEICSPGDIIVLMSVVKPESEERVGFQPGREIQGGITSAAGGVSGMVTPDSSVFRETMDQIIERQTSEARDQLDDVASALRKHDLVVETKVSISNDPATAILDNARSMKPTFIALVRRTHPRVGELFFGTVAKKILEAEVAPVLFVPPAST